MEQEQTEENGEEAKMPRAYSLQSSLFPPVKTCLPTGLLGIAGRDQRGLSEKRDSLSLARSVPCKKGTNSLG